MPDSAYLHLLINHIPVFGAGTVTLFFFYSILRKNEKMNKMCLISIVFLSLITIPVVISGNRAEGKVKGLEGITEENIEPHQDIAMKSFYLTETAGMLALIGLIAFRRKGPVPAWFLISMLVILIFVSGMIIYTAHLGGKISHSGIMEKQIKN